MTRGVVAGGLHREHYGRVHHTVDDGGGGARQHVQRRHRYRLVVLRGAGRGPAGRAGAAAVAGTAGHAGQPTGRQPGPRVGHHAGLLPGHAAAAVYLLQQRRRQEARAQVVCCVHCSSH